MAQAPCFELVSEFAREALGGDFRAPAPWQEWQGGRSLWVRPRSLARTKTLHAPWIERPTSKRPEVGGKVVLAVARADGSFYRRSCPQKVMSVRPNRRVEHSASRSDLVPGQLGAERLTFAAISCAHSGGKRWRLGDETRGWDWHRRQARRIFDEETEHDALGAGGTRRDEPGPAFAPERFTHRLRRRPGPPARCRWADTDTGEAVGRREVGDVEPRHSVAPLIARKLVHGRYATFGEMPVPLSPQRVLLLGEVESVDGLATLPAVVAGRLRPKARVRVVRNVAQPGACRADRIDVECQ